MEQTPNGKAVAQIDGQAEEAEAWRDIYAAKIGLAQILTLRVIFRYSFRVNRAAAWIPTLGVFEHHTGMGKKEIRGALDDLETYQMLEIKEAPAVNVLPHGNFPEGCFYLYFPRRVRTWSIAPRTNKQLQERAAMIDRWLRAFNAEGGPEGVDLFPPLWGHADTLAEVSRADEPPQVSPALATQSVQPASFRSGRSPDKDARVNTAVNTVGKNPMRGEKPHGVAPLNDWIVFNERLVSHSEHSTPLNEPAVGKNPTPRRPPPLETDERPEYWPPLEIERALMKRLNQMVDAWYAQEKAAQVKDKYGALWRTRIRVYPWAVEQAMFIAGAQWREIRVGLGEFMGARYLELFRKREADRQTKRREEYEAQQQAQELDPATVRAEVAESLHGRSAYLGVQVEGSKL